ncbi:MAG: carbon storage regulator [Oscillospiraceae bacterium]
MLVITRKADEGVIIGDNIRITVAEIGRDRVKLGIDAPGDIKIIRNELYYTEKFNVQAAMRKLPAELVSRIVNGENGNQERK